MKSTKKTAAAIATAALGVATALSVGASAASASTPPNIQLGGGVACPVGTAFYDVTVTLSGGETNTDVGVDHLLHYSMSLAGVPWAGDKGIGVVTCKTAVHHILFSYTDHTVTVNHPILGNKFTQNITPS